MFKKLLLILILAIGAFAAYVAMQPDDYRVVRSTKIDARPAAVFAQVNDFHNWEKWSPWVKLDPNAKETFEGPTSGKGAIFRWAGNAEVGEGSMTITDAKPDESVHIKLDFIKPMPGTADVEFFLKDDAGKTDVTWGMSGKRDFLGKAMCTIFNGEKMIGDAYDQGLANLKGVVEKGGAADAPRVEKDK